MMIRRAIWTFCLVCLCVVGRAREEATELEGVVTEAYEDVDVPQCEAPSVEELQHFESEEQSFQAETDRLMKIIIGSLYTDRDIFVRELISNAADALEKTRLHGLKDPNILKGGNGEPYEEFKILVKIDRERGELSFTDTGIGMTKEELVKNLGTVARSGTRTFIDSASQKDLQDSNLIGQFGLGFYSSYLVANVVTVISRPSMQKDQYIWISEADGKFKIYKDTRQEKLERGTSVILKMKDDASSYLDPIAMKKIIKRFSQFVNFPILLSAPSPNDDVIDWKLMNSEKPLWLRNKSDISREQYEAFYQSFFKTQANPIAYTHFHAEGDLEFSGIMYVPHRGKDHDMAPMDEAEGSNIKLYVQQVLISDNLKDFLPSWLRFVKGVIHSKDLPLKVDRETFTQSRVMRVIRNKSVNKIYETLKGLSKGAEKELEDSERINSIFEKQATTSDRQETAKLMESIQTEYPAYAKYANFWSKFGMTMVYGCMQDTTKADREKVLELYRTHSSYQKPLTSLAAYTKRMRPGQKKIYYLTGDDLQAMEKSPYMEKFEQLGIEVLMMTGAFEEGCLVQSEKYKDYVFQSIEKNIFQDDEFAFIDAGEDQTKLNEISKQMKRDRKATQTYYKPLLNWVKQVISNQAHNVILSKTLVKSPAMISSPSHGFTAAHEKLARTSLQGNQMMYNAFASMKNFELNANHPLINKLLESVQELNTESALDSKEAQQLNHTIDVLYECATIASGYPPRRPDLIIDDIYATIGIQYSLTKEDALKFKLRIPSAVYTQIDSEAAEKEKSKIDKVINLDDNNDEFDDGDDFDFGEGYDDDNEFFASKDEL